MRRNLGAPAHGGEKAVRVMLGDGGQTKYRHSWRTPRTEVRTVPRPKKRDARGAPGSLLGQPRVNVRESAHVAGRDGRIRGGRGGVEEALPQEK